jgi:predicted secreted Zn-dependent protease
VEVHAKGLVRQEESHMASSRKQGRYMEEALQEEVESRR